MTANNLRKCLQVIVIVLLQLITVGSPRSRSTRFYFSFIIFLKILLFLNLIHFSSTFNSYLCNIFATTFSNKSVLSFISHNWALWWTNSINRMECSQFCITKLTSLFRVSKGLEEQNCLSGSCVCRFAFDLQWLEVRS